MQYTPCQLQLFDMHMHALLHDSVQLPFGLMYDLYYARVADWRLVNLMAGAWLTSVSGAA